MTNNIYYIIITAIIGGFLLNFMPCVIPGIALKVVNLSKTPYTSIKYSLLGSWIGIMLFFITMSGTICIMKYLGVQYLWGSQMQNEYFLSSMVILLSAILGISINKNIYFGYNHKVINQSEFYSGFIHGLALSFVSTPCIGSVLASTIVFAMQFDNMIYLFIVIISIGIGFAAPYTILLIAPKLMFIILKIQKIAHIIHPASFTMSILVILWLFFLLLQNDAGLLFLPIVLLYTICIFFMAKKSNKTIKVIMWIMIFMASTLITINLAKKYIDNKAANIQKPHALTFNVKEIEKNIIHGKTVIVRFTADWCISCKVMDIYLFNSNEISDFIENNNIIYMVADITKGSSQEITGFMRDNNIAGIPSIYIASEKNPGGEVISGILKKGEFINIAAKHL